MFASLFIALLAVLHDVIAMPAPTDPSPLLRRDEVTRGRFRLAGCNSEILKERLWQGIRDMSTLAHNAIPFVGQIPVGPFSRTSQQF